MAIKPITDKPGAGVPFLQRMVGRMVVRRKGRQSFDKRHQDFQDETAAIIALCVSIPVAQRDTWVLIPPQMGLEDSSRNWSVNMVLEHLMVVTKGITQIVLGLKAGKTIPTVVSTADVKPTGQLTGDILSAFQQAMADCEIYLTQDTHGFADEPRHAHPWFGPLTAAQWHALLSVHHAVHRAQIVKIKQAIAKASP